MKKKSSPGLVLLRYFSGILAALILFIALANFIAGGGLFSTILLILAALFIAPDYFTPRDPGLSFAQTH